MAKSNHTAVGGRTFRVEISPQDAGAPSAPTIPDPDHGGFAAEDAAAVKPHGNTCTADTASHANSTTDASTQTPDEPSAANAPGACQQERRNLETRPWAAPNRPKHSKAKANGPAEVDAAQAAAALARILASPEFRSVPQLRAFLDYIVTAQLEGRQREVKGYSIAVNALGRDASFDPVSDPIVRVEAARLRRRLTEYYNGTGALDPVNIAVPKGSYLPVLSCRQTDTGQTGALVFLQTRRVPDRFQVQAPETGPDGGVSAEPAAGAPAGEEIDGHPSPHPGTPPQPASATEVGDAVLREPYADKRQAARPNRSFDVQPQMLAAICASCVVLGFILGRF